MFNVDNAIIMAAGTSSRFTPLSYERHKALTVVKGEVLIERQIRQLREAGIKDVYIVTGYKAKQMEYLSYEYDAKLIFNSEYLTRNNNGSIWTARDVLHNSYICSSDNYFNANPFEKAVDDSYYAAEYSEGPTNEWCITEDSSGYIDKVTIGGNDSWYMMGHTFWNEEFSSRFLKILEETYDTPDTRKSLWEKIYMQHLDVLKMRIRKYDPGVIFEFDSLDELRRFDESYIDDSRSILLKTVAGKLGVSEKDIVNIIAKKDLTAEAIGFEFDCPKGHYAYLYDTQNVEGGS